MEGIGVRVQTEETDSFVRTDCQRIWERSAFRSPVRVERGADGPPGAFGTQEVNLSSRAAAAMGLARGGSPG
jgi:hypothetical protein